MRMTKTEKTTSNYDMMNLFFFVLSSNQHRRVWNRALQTGNRNRCIPVIYLYVFFLSLARPPARMELSFCKYYRIQKKYADIVYRTLRLFIVVAGLSRAQCSTLNAHWYRIIVSHPQNTSFPFRLCAILFSSHFVCGYGDTAWYIIIIYVQTQCTCENNE